jgi:hypothetical protein
VRSFGKGSRVRRIFGVEDVRKESCRSKVVMVGNGIYESPGL